jgi:purine-nucleoside phosphorylase
MTDRDPVVTAAAYLEGRLEERPTVALVLGSGLGALAEAVDNAVVVPYADIPGFAATTVEGHAGRLVAGVLEGVDVVVFQGRHHGYEGHDPADLATPVRTAAALGAKTLIVTCAAGGVTRRLAPGRLMLLSDHINLMGRNPLVGPVREGEARFPDLTDAYDPALRQRARAAAAELGMELAEGVYAAMLGPSFETPAEIRMLERMGADAVGMSTVPEVIAARAVGLRVLGIALITNAAAGVVERPLDHEEVMEAGAAASPELQALVRGILARL